MLALRCAQRLRRGGALLLDRGVFRLQGFEGPLRLFQLFAQAGHAGLQHRERIRIGLDQRLQLRGEALAALLQ
jgi:hypothetical protein